MIHFANQAMPSPEPPPEPRGLRPAALVQLAEAVDVLEKSPRSLERSAYEQEQILSAVGFVPFKQSVKWLRSIARSEGVDALAWAEIVHSGRKAERWGWWRQR